MPARSTSRDKAYHFLRDEVLVDPAVQGRFLNELDLASRIGVSRTPVREALLVLVSQGPTGCSTPSSSTPSEISC